MATSKYCPKGDSSLSVLKNKSLPEIYELKEYIDIQESYEAANYKEQQEQTPRN